MCAHDGKPGHFCGHDGHSSILSGLALILDKEKEKLSRDVYLIFQPAEETGEGAAVCRELIKEKNIERIYGLHNIPGYPEKTVLFKKGTFACASTGLEIRMTGTPSHAAYPEAGKNPGTALAELLLSLQQRGVSHISLANVEPSAAFHRGADKENTGTGELCADDPYRYGNRK